MCCFHRQFERLLFRMKHIFSPPPPPQNILDCPRTVWSGKDAASRKENGEA
jgi:hypothetical protein